MDKKDIELLKSLYSKSKCKSKDAILKRFQERNTELMSILDKGVPPHLESTDKNILLLRLLLASDIDAVLDLGIYQSHISGDMKFFNEVLHTYSSLKYYFHLQLAGGYDHCIFLKNSLEAFSANDLTLVKKMFSEEKGLTSKGAPFLIAASNLIIALLYKKENWIQTSLAGAEKYVQKKNPAFDNAVVLYLMAVIREDVNVMSAQLKEICALYRKNKWLHDFNSPFLKVFSPFVHGLIHLSYHLLPNNLFEQLEIPEQSFVWKNLIEYNKSNGFNVGEAYLRFEGELEKLNVVYSSI